VDALAENLELHQKTLDLSDEKSRKELDAYVKLAREHRRIAAQLRETARHMAGYRDLPIGRHDERALADSKLVEAFEKFVSAEEELGGQLQGAVERDRQMLAAARGQRRGV
jgi:hypothetical protein